VTGGLQRCAFARSLTARAVSAPRGANGSDLEHFARHPRLGTGDLIQLAYFVAEHDDHDLAR
jgi:hypothetical protein